MNLKGIQAFAVGVISVMLCLTASADTAESICQVWRAGEFHAPGSGNCVFSQRQGFIGITLADGSRIDLAPESHMTYLDGDGNTVSRNVDEDGVNTFQWQDQKVLLRFGVDSGAQAD